MLRNRKATFVTDCLRMLAKRVLFPLANTRGAAPTVSGDFNHVIRRPSAPSTGLSAHRSRYLLNHALCGSYTSWRDISRRSFHWEMEIRCPTSLIFFVLSLPTIVAC